MSPRHDALATRTTLALRIGSSRDVLAVAEFAEASRAYRAACRRHEEAGKGSSTMPRGIVLEIEGDASRAVAYVSWNGRVWQGETIVFDPYATGGAR